MGVKERLGNQQRAVPFALTLAGHTSFHVSFFWPVALDSGSSTFRNKIKTLRLDLALRVTVDMMNKADAQSRPVVSLTVSPRTDGDRQILQRALSDFALQDASIRIGAESEGLFIIGGASETQLQSIRERILREYQIDADIDRPKVIYLGTIRKQAEAWGEFMCVTVKLRLEPLEEGDGYQFIDETSDGALPPEFIASVNSSIQDAMKAGILAGQEIVDLRVILCDGGYPREGSTESACKIAASMAFKEAVRRANPVILEPIMAVQIKGLEKQLSTSDIIGDLKSRRGSIIGLEHDHNSLLLRAIVPMVEMLGYSSVMRINTQGHADHFMQLIRYAEALPRSEPGDDEADGAAVGPNDPTPESGDDATGVLAFNPKDPKGKSGFAAAKLDPESE
jgi:translation elongation factor EF-G